ncbi:hypothetical protein C8R47DRAFT_1117945 [Mycena vitilis]|nr:hypothetical protein C8R47DRAFT_1117945 [Mycena vitilis]
MDPLSILSAVLSTSIAIYHWVDALKSKESAIQDLKSSVSSITVALHPLREKAASGALDSQIGVVTCLQELGECLNTAREHLQTWQESKARRAGSISRRILAFLDPSQVIDLVKEDRVRLNQMVTTLILATLAWTPGSGLQASASPLDCLHNAEAKTFWGQMIGCEVLPILFPRESFLTRARSPQTFRCSADTFCAALGTWLGVSIPDNLLLQLDEQGFGGVTPSSFAHFVGDQPLAQAISRYTRPIILPAAQGLDRLIVWVTENEEPHSSTIEYAESIGVKVVSFSSLAAVKCWMELNHQYIVAVAGSHRLRFISDSSRNEGGIFNHAAGELLLRYIRGRLLPSPCLIYAPSIDTTAYVTGYERAGSTTDVRIVWGYIQALAEGVRDVEWVGFNARAGSVQVAPPLTGLQDQWFIRPLLLYVTGTKPEQDQLHIDYAASLGITVVTLFATDELRRYVNANQA